MNIRILRDILCCAFARFTKLYSNQIETYIFYPNQNKISFNISPRAGTVLWFDFSTSSQMATSTIWFLQQTRFWKLFFAHIILIFFFFGNRSALANKYSSTESIILQLGEKLPLASNSKVWIEKSQIIQGLNEGGQAILKPLAEGQSLVRIDGNIKLVQVISHLKFQLYNELKLITKNRLGLNVSLKNSEVIIQGKMQRWTDWIDLSNAYRKYPAKYFIKAEIDPQQNEHFQKLLNNELIKQNINSQSFNLEREFRVVVPDSHPQLKEIENLMAPYGVNLLLDKTVLTTEPTIKVQITVAEVRRELTRKWGIQWPATAQAKLLPTGVSELSSVEFAANFLEQSGGGKILASPNIICRSGQEAEFMAGGEFPIKILNFKVQDVIWKKYGILLKVKPLADRFGKISLSLTTEVSNIDASRTVDGVPGILTNRVSSHFDLIKSQIVALSGLIKNETGDSKQGLPGLLNIPILGPLFSSNDFRENRTELIILVQPEILNDLPNEMTNRHLAKTLNNMVEN